MSKSESSAPILWLVLLENGKQLGPFKTDTMLNMISKGSLSGEEKVRKYPDGAWINISREPLFYDKLLDAINAEPSVSQQTQNKEQSKFDSKLSEEIEEQASSMKNKVKKEEEVLSSKKDEIVGGGEKTELSKGATSSSALPNQGKVINISTARTTRGVQHHRNPDPNEKDNSEWEMASLNDLNENKKDSEFTFSKTNKTNSNTSSQILKREEANENQHVLTGKRREKTKTNKYSQDAIELTDMYKIKKKHNTKKTKSAFYFFLVAVLLLIVSYLISETPTSQTERVHLIKVDYKNSEPMDIKEAQIQLQKATAIFYRDTFESYYDAQIKLVKIIEGSKTFKEPRGLLCLVYKELWPFVKQDTDDMNALNFVIHSTKNLEPLGANSAYCDLAKLFILGKEFDAKGVVNHFLNQQSLSTDPVLFTMKAELLTKEGDYKTSNMYIERVIQYQSQWLKPQLLMAFNFEKLGQFSEALRFYESILKLNPKHKMALISYGILLSRNFNKKEEGLKYLQSGLKNKDKIERIKEASAYFTAAKLLLEKKETGKSLEYAKKAYELSPSDSSIKDLFVRLGGDPNISSSSNYKNELIFLGDQYFRAGDFLSAQAQYKAAYDIDKQNAVAAMKAAKSLWSLNQSTEATNWLNKAVKADPKLVEAYVLLADYLSQRYDYQSAANALKKAAQVSKNNNEIFRGYGLIEYRRNNYKDAISSLERSLKLYENDVETLILLAKAYGASAGKQKAEETQNYLKLAQNYIIRAIELDGANNEAQLVYAKILSQMKGVDSGIFYIKDLIEKFSYTIEFRLGLAELYKESERAKPAQEIYEQVLLADPRNKEAYIGLGECLQSQAQFDKAIKNLLNASIIDPSDASPLFKVALVYLDLNKYQDAITYFKKVLKINPLYPKTFYYIGKAAYLAGDYKLALEGAQEEKNRNPNIVDSYILAAEAYAANKDFQKCSQEYQQALKLNPTGADLYVKIARCYRQSGNPDIAESMLSIAQKQESGHPEIYKEQGAIFEQKGDLKAASQSYEKYLGLSPNAPDKKEIERKINSISGP